ncbi:MAG: hypothetical protein O3A01_01905 [bacterium]|nr:hypothetical protein [bacterium]
MIKHRQPRIEVQLVHLLVGAQRLLRLVPVRQVVAVVENSKIGQGKNSYTTLVYDRYSDGVHGHILHILHQQEVLRMQAKFLPLFQ